MKSGNDIPLSPGYTRTRRPASAASRDVNKRVLTVLNTAVLLAMAMAIIPMAIAERPGLRQIRRTPYFKSRAASNTARVIKLFTSLKP